MLQSFHDTLGHRDPAIIKRLAKGGPVVLLANNDVGKSNGKIPLSPSGRANKMFACIEALDIKQIDVLNCPMGGCVAHMVTIIAPKLVHQLILATTQPSISPGVVLRDTEPFLNFAHAETPTGDQHLRLC